MTTQAERIIAQANADAAKFGGNTIEVNTTSKEQIEQQIQAGGANPALPQQQQPNPQAVQTTAAQPALPADNTPHAVDPAVAQVNQEDEAKRQHHLDQQYKSLDDMSDEELLALDPDIQDRLLAGEDPATVFGAQPPAQQQQQPNTDPQLQAGQPQPAQPVATAQPEPVMIPIERLNQEIQKRRELEQQIIYQQGRESAFTQQGQNPQAAQPVKSLDDQIKEQEDAYLAKKNELATKTNELAKAYDDGDIDSMADYETQRANLQTQYQNDMRSIAQQRHNLINQKNTPSPEQLQAQVNEDPLVQKLGEDLTTQNPWLSTIPQDKLDELAELARVRMQRSGQAVEPTVRSTILLRQTVAALGRGFGYDRMYAPQQQPAGQPGQPQPVLQGQPSPQQRQDKITLQNGHPPAMGGTGTGVPATNALGNYSEQDILQMSEVEIAQALPQGAVERALGISG